MTKEFVEGTSLVYSYRNENRYRIGSYGNVAIFNSWHVIKTNASEDEGRILSRPCVLCRVHYHQTSLINAANKIMRYRYLSGWYQMERSIGNHGALFIVSFLSYRNFTVRIKDGGPWPSLNFKLKNTIGYIALLKNSLCARVRELFPLAVCFTSRDKNQICEYSAPGLRPTCIGFRALNI